MAGWSTPAPSSARTAARVGRPASTTTSRLGGWKASGHGSSAATCSARYGDRGPTSPGAAGGVRILPIARPCSFFRTTGVRRWRWRAGPSSTFVTEGIEAALERARAAAGELDVRVGGGVATLREYLQAGLIDEMHLAVAPILLGAGEHLLAGLDLPALGYRCTDSVPSAKAVHYILARTS
jgi:hypothetical protein